MSFNNQDNQDTSDSDSDQIQSIKYHHHNLFKCLLFSSNIEVHKIFRCSHLNFHYFSKTIVEKKRIVDIYLLKIFLVSIHFIFIVKVQSMQRSGPEAIRTSSW